MLGIIGSFNPKFYKKIAAQSLVKSFGFLIVFVIIVSAVVSYKYTVAIKRILPEVNLWADENLGHIASGFPVIEIKDGCLTFPKEAFVKEWDEFIFIIDPQAQNVYEILEEYSNIFLLTRKELLIKTTKSDFEHSEIKVYKLENINLFKIVPCETGVRVFFEDKEIDITPSTVERLTGKLSSFLYSLVFLWFLGIYFFTKPLQILVFSLISLIFNANLKAALPYKQLLNIGIYALVPCTSLAVVANLANLTIPLFWAVYLLIYSYYLFIGIRGNRKAIS